MVTRAQPDLVTAVAVSAQRCKSRTAVFWSGTEPLCESISFRKPFPFRLKITSDGECEFPSKFDWLQHATSSGAYSAFGTQLEWLVIMKFRDWLFSISITSQSLGLSCWHTELPDSLCYETHLSVPLFFLRVFWTPSSLNSLLICGPRTANSTSEVSGIEALSTSAYYFNYIFSEVCFDNSIIFFQSYIASIVWI